MEKIDLKLKVEAAFGNLYRDQCVLIAAINENGQILTGAKPNFFPPGITRLLGGGVNRGEGINDAAVREMSEELGVSLEVKDLIPLAQFNTHAEDSSGKTFYNETYLYAAKIGNASYKAGDDVKHIIVLNTDEMRELGNAYENLPQCLWYRGEEGDFSWNDYGKLYSVIHTTTANKILALGLHNLQEGSLAKS
jgi:ADP-ribose pyrophosphatase YjhB (NUDIX family)